MNVNKVLVLFIAIVMWGCSGNAVDRWDIEVEPLNENIEIKNVSKLYYEKNISNEELVKTFPEFFENIDDKILSNRRSDDFGNQLQNAVEEIYKEDAIQDSLKSVFARVRHYFPQFALPTVYLFTGELNYQQPVVYYSQSNEMVIGPDWFLGENSDLYKKIDAPNYFKKQMNPANFKSKIVKSLADEMVSYDIRKRKFVEKMIYEGKLMVVQDALLPHTADSVKIGYTAQQMDWAKENEANVYLYFTENELFYDDDKKLDARFLDEAPFSKFYSDNDMETPGKIGVWIGWQICRAYLAEHEEVTLQSFLQKNDYQKIFTESGYKPTN